MIKCIVPISGGKDSQACLKLALKEFKPDEILGLFCDTKFEHPLTYAHVENIGKLYGVEIKTLNAGSVEEKIRRYKQFPVGGARHCTDELKLVPARNFYKALAEQQGAGFQVWLGMRFEESNERAARYFAKVDTELYPPHEILRRFPKYLEKIGVMFRLPILDWTKHEVLQSLEGQHNPLYDHGFDRVGCFPCMAGGDKWKEKAFAFDEIGVKHKQIMMKVAEDINKPIWTSIGGSMRNNPDQQDLFTGCSICAI